MPKFDDPEIQFALNAVRQASLLVKAVQADMVLAALTKDDLSPVTVADFASQALVAYLLEQAYPADSLVAEENASELRPFLKSEATGGSGVLGQVTAYVKRFAHLADVHRVCDWIDRGASGVSQRFWTLDPIDGTKGFLRGDQYAVALALVVSGQVAIGVLGCPNLVIKDDDDPTGKRTYTDVQGSGSLVLAARGQGCWVTSLAQPGEYMQLHISEISQPAQARLLRSFESGHTNVDQINDFAQALGIRAEAVRMDSQAKYAVLAAGDGDLLLRLLSPSKPDYREKIWDQAAGSLILQEAGGMITDLDGKALDFSAGRSLTNNRGILASNTHLHSLALQALRNVGA
jgi:HAL2 family 3'(2'),5'-bisphosphate nucleotidase